MTARERMVRVVAEAVRSHRLITPPDRVPDPGWRCSCGLDEQWGGWTAPVLHAEHAAEAVVAAMEAQMGLREERGYDDSIEPKGDDWTSALVRNSLAAARQKWPDFGMAHRIVTDWQEDEG